MPMPTTEPVADADVLRVAKRVAPALRSARQSGPRSAHHFPIPDVDVAPDYSGAANAEVLTATYQMHTSAEVAKRAATRASRGLDARGSHRRAGALPDADADADACDGAQRMRTHRRARALPHADAHDGAGRCRVAKRCSRPPLSAPRACHSLDARRSQRRARVLPHADARDGVRGCKRDGGGETHARRQTPAPAPPPRPQSWTRTARAATAESSGKHGEARYICDAALPNPLAHRREADADVARAMAKNKDSPLFPLRPIPAPPPEVGASTPTVTSVGQAAMSVGSVDVVCTVRRERVDKDAFSEDEVDEVVRNAHEVNTRLETEAWRMSTPSIR
ncbi:hypothetical protein DFH06DRAFT_1327384 [Mycena polygramma]|nr:hypothetical protein DFH06DRAFT_1327384 [Mycena polygramma]